QRWSRTLWRTIHLARTGEQGPNDNTAGDVCTSCSRFLAEVEPYECYWWNAIVHRYGDAERASSRRRRASYAFQQQRGGQRSFQRDGSGRKQQRNLHGERVNSSHINFCHHLGFVQQYNSDSKSCSIAVATWKSRKSKEVPCAIEQGKYAKP